MDVDDLRGRVTQGLERYVRPATLPLAVKMLAATGDIPDRAKVPLRDLKKRVAACQSLSLARRYGWLMAVTREDQSCPIGSVVMGFQEAVPYYTEGNLAAGMYTASKEAGARSEDALARFPLGLYPVLLAGPLARFPYEPDLVVVYGNAAQVMRLVQAALYREGGVITSGFAGRAACSHIIVTTMETGRPQVILPCTGDRIFGQTQDDEMAFAFPWPHAPGIIEGLEETHKAGVRYPIPSYLQYEVHYPPSYQELERHWRQGSTQN